MDFNAKILDIRSKRNTDAIYPNPWTSSQGRTCVLQILPKTTIKVLPLNKTLPHILFVCYYFLISPHFQLPIPPFNLSIYNIPKNNEDSPVHSFSTYLQPNTVLTI